MYRCKPFLAIVLTLVSGAISAGTNPLESTGCAERMALLWLDHEAQIAIVKTLTSDGFAELRYLSARHQYVERKISQRRGDEESTLGEFEAEELRLRPVRSAYTALSLEIQDRQEFFTDLRFGDGPLAIALIQESQRSNPLEPAIESARAALADFRRNNPTEELLPPCASSRRALKMFRRMHPRAQQKAIELLNGAMKTPYSGDMKTTFPSTIRFLAFTSQGSYRLVYEIKSDGEIFLHGVGPRQNFYEEFTDLQ